MALARTSSCCICCNKHLIPSLPHQRILAALHSHITTRMIFSEMQTSSAYVTISTSVCFLLEILLPIFGHPKDSRETNLLISKIR